MLLKSAMASLPSGTRMAQNTQQWPQPAKPYLVYVQQLRQLSTAICKTKNVQMKQLATGAPTQVLDDRRECHCSGQCVAWVMTNQGAACQTSKDYLEWHLQGTACCASSWLDTACTAEGSVACNLYQTIPAELESRTVNKHRLPCAVALLRWGRLTVSSTVLVPEGSCCGWGSSTPDSTNIKDLGGGSCLAAASLAADVDDAMSVVAGCCRQSRQSQNTIRCLCCGISAALVAAVEWVLAFVLSLMQQSELIVETFRPPD